MRIVELFSLKDRVALVTGGGSGIGQAIARGLAAHGACVICAGRTMVRLEETVESIIAAGGEAHALSMDLSHLESIRKGVSETLSRHDRIDILVNNAGVNFREKLEDVSEEHFDEIVSVNLKGLFFLTQVAAKSMVARKRGKIVNIGSLTTGYGLTSLSVYASTKGAVGQFSKEISAELAPHNIQVNTLCPGFVITPLTQKLWSQPVMKEWGAQRIPMGRTAQPEEMVGTAIFLASAASDYVTGQEIYVDGGFMGGERWPIPGDGSNNE